MKKNLGFYLFILSFFPLWIIVLLLNIKSVFVDCTNNYIVEYLTFACIPVLIIISIINVFRELKTKNKNGFEKYTIVEFKKNKEISLNGLVTFCIALVAFDFTTWYGMMSFLIIFICMMILSVKNYYMMPNIIIEIFNYTYYECIIENIDGVRINRIIITNKSMMKNRKIYLKPINNDYMFENDYDIG